MAAVDAAHPAIVAHRLSSDPADYGARVPLADAGRRLLGRKPREVSGIPASPRDPA